jgi:FAD/FMN-containing dehydrogenase
VVAAAGCAARRGVPLVARGAGTGNYGQAVPLRGGIVLDLSNLRDVVSFDARDGVVRAGAGALLGELEDHVRREGWELRQHPSTRRTATLGGFVAGGSTGVGALLHGGLAEDGAVMGLRVVTAEGTPRVLELAGRDVFPVVHAYGTNGIITQVEVPLARAQPWWDMVLTFPTLRAAAAFALDVGVGSGGPGGCSPSCSCAYRCASCCQGTHRRGCAMRR